jgi:tRNA pseudouridine55 synthase
MLPDFNEGAVLLLDKPLKWTSFDVVSKVRNETRAKKVGHAGTLDPLATGLLIVCTGKLTKTINDYQGMEKEYTGTLYLGSTTPSYDRETEPDEFFDISGVTEDQVRQTATQFLGTIEQYPPAHSAKLISGERAYQKARRGEKIEMRASVIEVKEFEIQEVRLPYINFRIVCSKGTYIRSIAHDMGRKLGTGAHLASLCRTRIGSFHLKDAWQLSDFVEKVRETRKNQEKAQ